MIFLFGDLRNSIINLEKKIPDAKLIKKILRYFPERFKIKVTPIKESKDLDNMKIEELVGSLQTYEFFLPPIKKAKSIAFKVTKGKSKNSSNDEDEIAMFARNFRKLMNFKRFKNKKNYNNFNRNPKGVEQEKSETHKKDPRDSKCFEC
jgi:hypothetical protein